MLANNMKRYLPANMHWIRDNSNKESREVMFSFLSQKALPFRVAYVTLLGLHPIRADSWALEDFSPSPTPTLDGHSQPPFLSRTNPKSPTYPFKRCNPTPKPLGIPEIPDPIPPLLDIILKLPFNSDLTSPQ